MIRTALVPLVDDLQARDRRPQRRDALLAVDEDLLVGRDLAALERGADRLPGDQVADGVALVEGVHQVADLDAVPDERALELRDRDAVRVTSASNCVTADWVTLYFAMLPAYQKCGRDGVAMGCLDGRGVIVRR